MLRFVQPPFPCLWSDGLLRSSNLAFVTKDGCFSCSLLDSLPLTNYLLCQRQKSFVFCFGKTHNLSRACIWAIFEREHIFMNAPYFSTCHEYGLSFAYRRQGV